MLDLSDDEELQRLREAALKSKRKPDKQDKTDESEENKTPQTVPGNPPIQVQIRPPVFPHFYAPTQPPIILPLPQPLPSQQLNSLHFNAYTPQFLTHPPAPPLLNRVAPIKSRINNSKKMDFGRKSSPGFKASNLIVITGNESDNSGHGKVSRRNVPLYQQPAKPEESIIDRPQDRWNSDKDQSTFNRDERAKIGKFDRYKSNESSEDENYISPSDDSDSESSGDGSDSEEANIKDVEEDCVKDETSLTGNESADKAKGTKTDSPFENKTSDIENDCRRSMTTSKSPERKRMLSFSDDVEELQLDIPDSSVVQISKTNNYREGKESEEKFYEPLKKSIPSHESTRKKSHPSRSPLERYQPPSLRNREKSADKNQDSTIHYKNSKTERLSSRSTKIDSVENSTRMASRSTKDNNSKRSQAEFKRKYGSIREECYDRSPEALQAYRKARYFDLPEYPIDYTREYGRGYSHHHQSRQFEKSETYPIRESEDHYFYPEERRDHEDYHDRVLDYYRVYPDSQDNHYRYSLPQKRYRAQERDRYSSEREVQRVEMRRAQYEGEHHAQRPAKRTNLNTNHIPSLLEGIYIDGYAVEDNLHLLKSRVMRSEGMEQHSKQMENSRTKEAHESKSKKSSENFRSKEDKKNPNAKDASERKTSRRVVESRNGDKERLQDHLDSGNRSRNQDQHSATQKTNSLSEKKSNNEIKSFDKKSSIHHRLGSKPDKKGANSCRLENPAVITA